MDAFLTEEMKAARRRARTHFLRLAEESTGDVFGPAADMWRALEPGPAGLGARAVIIDEIAAFRPRVGLGMLDNLPTGETVGSAGEKLLHLARLAGTVAHVFAAASRAALEKGFFSSALLGFRDVQMRLAGLVSGVETLRLGTCRVGHLLDRGDSARAGAEVDGFLAHARSLVREAGELALGLLGEGWLRNNLPGDDPFLKDERSRE